MRPEVRSFYLTHALWGTRCVKGKAHCAISVVSRSCAKDAQEWGTHGAGSAGEIKSLGQLPKFCGYPVRLESCCGRWRLPSFARLGRARAPVPTPACPHTTLAHGLFDF